MSGRQRIEDLYTVVCPVCKREWVNPSKFDPWEDNTCSLECWNKLPEPDAEGIMGLCSAVESAGESR
jgi:hypothetical protein